MHVGVAKNKVILQYVSNSLNVLFSHRMESCTFPRYNENDIIVQVRSCLLTGSEAKNLSKSDLFPNVKVRPKKSLLVKPDNRIALTSDTKIPWFTSS